MHLLKRITLLVCVLAIVPFATAKNNFGINETGRVIFHSPTRVAGNLLPAGEYIVRHTMEGQEHIMVFEAVDHQVQPVKAKCQLVQLESRADQTCTVYEFNGTNERLLQELVFRRRHLEARFLTVSCRIRFHASYRGATGNRRRLRFFLLIEPEAD